MQYGAVLDGEGRELSVGYQVSRCEWTGESESYA
jgi:hypothetical protein